MFNKLAATTVALLAVGATGVTSASAQQTMSSSSEAKPAAPAAAVAPKVGDVAPDFTATAADSTGARTAPIALHDLRGKVVVLAFYPKDRSSGCTAELHKFRDEYSKLFGGNVTVLPISIDDIQSHEGWAKDDHFPFALVSDPGGKIASEYGSIMQYQGQPYASRSVFVVGKDGRIVYRELKFGALDQHAYDALAQAVKQAKSE